MPKICAIVVTYNGMQWLDRCLGSLRESSIPLRTVVIDNASTDGSAAYIQERYPQVELIARAENAGFGRGNNIGLELALAEGADYVLLLNQDAWIAQNCVEQLINISRDYPDFGILSPVHLEANDEKLEKHFANYVSPGYCQGFLSDLYFRQMKDVYPTKFVNAACWLISRNCLETVGIFDPLFPHYGEDEDMVQRLHYFQLQIGVVPGAKMWHDITYKSWEEMFWNKSRMRTFALSKLKNIKTTLRSAALFYFKESFDSITSFILMRKFRKAWNVTTIAFSIFLDLSRINKSRKISKNRSAYIDDQANL